MTKGAHSLSHCPFALLVERMITELAGMPSKNCKEHESSKLLVTTPTGE